VTSIAKIALHWDLREKLFKSLGKLEPMNLTVVEEYQDRIAA